MSARRQSGFALVAVLWILAALAALAAAYSTFAVNSAASAYLPQQRLRLDAALRAAVELTAYRQLSWPKEARPTSGRFTTRLGDARIDVNYRAENARIDINNAHREILSGLFVALGEKQPAADFFADRIVAWRAPLTDQAKATETEIYAKASLSYGPVGAPFDNVLELAMLPKMSPTLLSRALPFLTVFSGSGKINPAIADAVVLAALPGMTAKTMSALRSAAASAHAADFDGGAFSNFVGVDPSESVRAQIFVTFPDRRSSAEIVLRVTADAPEPYQLLYWRDDLDGSR